MADLKSKEMQEFPKLCAWYENKIKKLYGAVKFNYFALMMKDEFVHFHIIPRYDRKIEKYGIIWEDSDYPKASSLSKIDVDKNILEQIKQDLKEE